jgi:ArsR family transcriptional regulator, lead/cadmium/zinc/bismuth-responsive transcriptional repressor
MKIFKILADDTKLSIIKYLISHECCDCICKIRDVMKKDHSVILKDVKALENAGIIWTKKEGKFLRCGVNDKDKIRRLVEISEEIQNGKRKKESKRKKR